MNGVLSLYKPKGMTSHDCVMKLRRLFQTKKVGHTGTLDPEVDGVLVICIGEATKIVSFLTDQDKTYEGEAKIGFSTTTEDAHGEKVEEKEVTTPITEDAVDEIIKNFHGEQVQIPPMYSAVKVNGKKLYEYARKGETVERPKRTITIYSLVRTSPIEQSDATASFTFDVSCSKGTYIRTLAVDIGKALGYPAHMSMLRRTRSGAFSFEDCVTLEELEGMELEKRYEQLHSLEKALYNLPTLTVDAHKERLVGNGVQLREEQLTQFEQYIVLKNEDGNVIGIYEHHPTKQDLCKPARIFHN